MACLLPICFCELDYTLSAPASPSETSISSLHTPAVSLTISRHGNLKSGKFIFLQEKKSDRYLPVAFLYSNLRSFHWKKQSGVKINDLGIGTENIFISPRLFFQDGRVPRRIFCEERIAIAFVIPGKPLSKKKIQY